MLASATLSACAPHGVQPVEPAACDTCHLTPATSVTPLHTTSEMDCSLCHETAAWSGVTSYTHVGSYTPEGAHAALDCRQCHVAVFVGTSADCAGCHQADFASTTNPDHETLGFSTTCNECHGQTAWVPADDAFHDTFFPISSGNHARLDCTDCHNSGTLEEFTCVDCHEHRQSKMDAEHRGVFGYKYQSSSCFRCHPRGRE